MREQATAKDPSLEVAELETQLPLSDNSPKPTNCGTCQHSKTDTNLLSYQRVCGEGYGIKSVSDKPVNKWCYSDARKSQTIKLGYCGTGIGGDE